MSAPEKRTGFFQGLYEISSTKKEDIGAIRRLRAGRVFRYARAGADLLAGKMAFASEPNAGWLYKACPAAPVGAVSLTLTVTAGGTLSEGQLENGLFIVTKGASVGTAPDGYMYEIAWNSALAADGTSLTIVLRDPLVAALTTSDYFRIQPSVWASVNQSSGATSVALANLVPAGVPLVNVPSGYYCWLMTKGIGAAKIKPRKAQTVMSLYPGQGLSLSVSAGYLLAPSMTTMYPRNPPVAKFIGAANSLSAYVRHAFPVLFDVEK